MSEVTSVVLEPLSCALREVSLSEVMLMLTVNNGLAFLS